ncbi:hypothetical protein ACJH6J_24040 [Mycobacterium sp. SMC-18]|uniref:hypothetical protein n=1 Tax=unclassified Mycobacterium TaxID=2642494 RepID=UPI0038772B41
MGDNNEKLDAVVLERYKYINSQLAALNDSAHKFLSLYQTLTAAIVTAGLALFVGYRGWGISADNAHKGLIGLLLLQAIVAAFTCAFLLAGVASWLDYRREEVTLLRDYLDQSFREAPKIRNFYRWYETYMVLLVVASAVVISILALTRLSPAMK